MKKSSMFQESEKHSFFRKYGYYMVLAACVLSIGAAGWGAMKKMTTPPKERIISTTSASSDTEDKKAGVNVSGIEKETTTAPFTEEKKTEAPTKEKTEPATTASAKTTLTSEALNAAAGKPYESYFMAPIGNGVIKAYSNGELVYSETMNDWRVHGGTDFKAEKESPVKAMTDGIVTDVYEDSLMGVIVEVNHGNGVIAKYCGLNKNPPVKKDAALTMGQTIGTVGNIPIESVEQYHLHLEVTIDRKPIDPASILKSK